MAIRAGRGSRKKSGGKWIAWFGLLLAGFLAVKTGWAGFGWAHLKSIVRPDDDGLLEWIPADAQAVAIVDPHQIRPSALGSPASAPRAWLERMRADVKTATGIDLAFDVDKLAVTPSLVVMSGRFHGDDVSKKLAEYKYKKAEYGGHTYLVRQDEDALMTVEDDLLLYGDETSIRGAIDARGGASLAKNGLVVGRLAHAGYRQPLVATAQLSDRPSLRSMITGSTGPRSVTLGIRSLNGIDVDATIEAANPAAADELGHLLDEKRADVGTLAQAAAGPQAGALLAKIAHDASVGIDPGAGAVKLHTHVSDADLDVLIHAVEASPPLSEMYKTVRLFQLLAPNP